MQRTLANALAALSLPLALGATGASVVRSSCLIECRPDRARTAEVLFLGYPVAAQPLPGHEHQLTFIVDKVWKGELADTALVIEPPVFPMCQPFLDARGPQFVIARREGDRLIAEPACPTESLLGPPQRSADPRWIHATLDRRHGPDPRLQHHVFIDGRLYQNRHPLAGALVEIPAAGISTRTDSSGRFRFAEFRPGVYLLRLTPPQGAPSEHWFLLSCRDPFQHADGECRTPVSLRLGL
jgi:hypothetical protein